MMPSRHHGAHAHSSVYNSSQYSDCHFHSLEGCGSVIPTLETLFVLGSLGLLAI